MKNKNKIPKFLVLGAVFILSCGTRATAQTSDTSEIDQLKAQLQAMQTNMDAMQQKIDQLEQEKAAGQTSTNMELSSPSIQAMEKAAEGQDIGKPAEVENRHALDDQQEAAPRPDDETLNPQFRGYFPIPNTPALIMFNAKPRLDITSDTQNSGNPDRFVTAQIPVKGEANYGGSEQFNVNARGSQLRVDVRAPDMPGNFRFYYQNDFFGGGGGMSYRLQQLYGQFYNITAGFTYSCFEDPDAWPNTVDYEGPNSAVFARRALVRYMLPLGQEWRMNFGVEAPGSEVDTTSAGVASLSQVNSAPDGTMNIRWENAEWGHVQLGGVVRDIAARGTVNGAGVNESVFGWGVNLSDSINVFKHDSFQTQLTAGHGIFRYINDDFQNNDAAFNSANELKALSCYGIMAGYTHQWTESFSSTASYGFVDIENESTQSPSDYHQTHYGSLNVIWQIRKHLSVGVEGLYGRKEEHSGAAGDVWRFQTGLVYSLF